MKETKVKCNQCNSEGCHSDSEHAGAEYHTEDGECMGYCPIQVLVQCNKCYGMGYIIEYSKPALAEFMEENGLGDEDMINDNLPYD